jgi:exoribonuclease R
MIIFTIEVHGNKQVGVNNNNIVSIESSDFIIGDKVYLDENNKYILYEREEQAVIGIVRHIYKKEAYIYILNSKFAPKIPNNKYCSLDKLVLWLHKDGKITVKNKYTNDAINDYKCLLDMYSLTSERPIMKEKLGNHLYTIDQVINHNNLDTFTIDPTNSVDFDDAITVDVENKTIYIHIVDIANFNLPQRFRERCLTLYLSNEHTEHLLDEKDASDILSLVVDKERNVITVKIVIDDGLVTKYDIYKSTIIVKKRWNYEQVLDAINNNVAPESILFLANLTKKRSENTNYNINLPSIRITSDKSTGDVESIVSENTSDISHSLVATAMILANITVSKHLSSQNVKLPNRFHESLRGFTTPNFEKTGNEFVDSFIMIKKFARACYAVDKKGHFGLDITDYVHFTSPMRRYADVIVHRLLAGYQIEDDVLQDEVLWMNKRATLVRSCQDTYITWKVNRWLKKTNDLYEIWITGINKSGILWFIPNLSINGFMHVSSLGKEQWEFIDETLIGKTSNKVIKIGSKLMIKVDKIDDITGLIIIKIA